MRFKTAEKVRLAISAGRYSEAGQLLEQYRREVEAGWREASSEQERSVIARQVTGLLEWARAATLAGRSHTQNKLIQMSRRGAYTPAAPSPNGLELDA